MAIKIECPKCQSLNELEADRCWRCKTPVTEEQRRAAVESFEHTNVDAAKAAATLREVAEKAFWNGGRDFPEEMVNAYAARVAVSTSPFVYGREIEETVDIITAECAFGMNFFKDLFMGLTDFFGGRSGTAQKAFREARKICLVELRKEALLAGGNAVVQVNLTYNELSGQGKGMLFLVASGTAVRLKS